MQSILPLVVGIPAILIHIILNHDLYTKGVIFTYAEKKYRIFCHSVLHLFIVETAWGVAYNFSNILIMKILTYWFFVSIGFVTLMWNEFIVDYLDESDKMRRIITTVGRIFFFALIIVLLLNVFYPVMFAFDDEGKYHVYTLRYIASVIQLLLYIGATARSLNLLVRTKGEKRTNHMAVFGFGIILIVTCVLQAWMYSLPINSIGFLIGGTIIYVYVIKDERINMQKKLAEEQEAHRQDIEKALEAAMKENELVKRQYRMIDALSRGFGDAFLVSLSNNETRTLKKRGVLVNDEESNPRQYSSAWIDYIEKYVHPEDKSRVRALTSSVMVRAKLKESDTYVLSYRVVYLEQVHYYRVNFYKVNENLYIDDLIIMSYECIDDIVNSEKQREEELKSLSNSAYIDELTGLKNRRAFEEKTEELETMTDLKNIAVVTLDVNCLKATNDEHGHDAGDELLRGAARVIQDTFGEFGVVYRTGGDEFVGILDHDIPSKDYLREKLYDKMENWHGEKVDTLAISHGIACSSEYPGENIGFLISKADKLMYADKADFYASRGIDRRLQQTAYSVLCDSYIKVLTIDLATDSYQVIAITRSEKDEPLKYENVYSEWIADFIENKRVAQENADEFIAKTGPAYIINHFRETNESICFVYKRANESGFENVMMEIKKARDFSEETPNVYLFVKKIL